MIEQSEHLMKQKLTLIDLIKLRITQVLGQPIIDYLFKLTNSDQMLHNYILLLNSLYMVVAQRLVTVLELTHECKPQFLLVKGTPMSFNDYIATINIDQLKSFYGLLLRYTLLMYTSWDATSSRPNWNFKKMQIINHMSSGTCVIIPLLANSQGKEIEANIFEYIDKNDGSMFERMEKIQISLDFNVTGLPNVKPYKISRSDARSRSNADYKQQHQIRTNSKYKDAKNRIIS